MRLKRLLCLLFPALTTITVNAQFNIGINKHSGALNQIANPGDPHGMNWIFASGDKNLTWQKADQDWGLGKYDVAAKSIYAEKWTTPEKRTINGLKSSFTYKTRCLNVLVTRQPEGNDFVETYTFTNTTGTSLVVSGLDIYAPYNDSYPDAKTSATNRCNTHVWPGMNASYVNAIRMDGEGRHLGLVLTKGVIATYSIANRDHHKDVPWTYTASNVRGVITFNVAPFSLSPNGTYTVQWKLFWHNGWNEFYSKAIKNGFVKLSADRYSIEKGQKLQIEIETNAASGIKTKFVQISQDSLGEHTYTLRYNKGRKSTILNYQVISSAQNLIDKRVQFIVDHQQMNNPADSRDGAYMVYDNELHRIFDNPINTVSNADRDEGRERIGMGVLIAKWLQSHSNDSVQKSLLRYVKFVREKLQTPAYQLFSNVGHTSGPRSYNYPWVAHLYLETYKLTKNKQFLADFYGTLRRNFQEAGYKHYSIDFRVQDGLDALEQAGMKTERDSLLDAYIKTGDFFVTTGIYYPQHEVNYEQSIVAPAVTFLCEMYLVTKEQKYLDAATVQLRSLEAFNGMQPDVHLFDIAIRHWDGYWFGKKPTWGDVMPHYWSTLTAISFLKYYQCTGDASYKRRAEGIVENNLLNFKEDGTASCAYLYPAFINNIPGKFYDAFANDQDWALVFYKEVMDASNHGQL